MTDTIAKGSGNSRTLKTVPNALTLYPDFPSMMAALIDGTFPIDLGPLNEAGVQVHGTDLNKASLLTDSTESSIWGSAANRTVNQALAQLRSLVSTAQSTANSANSNANGRGKIVSGSYVGNNSYGEANPNTLTFSFLPKLVVISKYKEIRTQYGTTTESWQYFANKYGGSSTEYIWFLDTADLTTSYVQNAGFGISNPASSSLVYGKKSADGRTIYWYNTYNGLNQFNYIYDNYSNRYYYIAIG